MNKSLVIGGAGFLGSHLCEELLARGHQVICVDDFSTGQKRNIQHLTGHRRFEALRHDICFPLQMAVDEIYNLSCPASPMAPGTDPGRVFQTCVLGTLNLLELAWRNGARLLMTGNGEHRWEAGDLARALEESEAAAERLLFKYHHQRQVVIRVARIFATYGPRMPEHDGRILRGMITHALEDQPITIPGRVFEPRSLCYVDDLVAGLIALMEGPEDLTGPVDLGGTASTLLLDLARQVVRQTGSRSLIQCLPTQPGAPTPARPDLTSAHRTLGWQAKVPLETGLRRTIDYFHWLRTNPPWAFDGPAEAG